MRFQRYIKLSEIVIAPNRQRRHFGPAALNDLRESIQRHGLFHAVVLRREGDKLVLVSGERRLRAIDDLYQLGGTFTYDDAQVPAGEVPWTDLGDLDPLAREEAELSENIHRADLTFQERAATTLRLAELRSKQAAQAGLPTPSTADIAEEVKGSRKGSYQETTRRELIVARHAEEPEVKNAKTLDEAYTALKRKEETKRNVALAEQVGRTFTADVHTALNADSLEWLASCPADQFDVILTDPPYGMGADEFGDSGGKAQGAHGYEDSPENLARILAHVELHFYRIAKPQAHLYWFCDIDQFHAARLMFERSAWWVHRTPLIWHKPSAARMPWPEHGPQRKWEMILYAVKGKRPVTRIFPDLVSIPSEDNLGHAAQKPVALFEDLLRRSVRPGDSVLDCFSGTGTIFTAAHRLKCRATGIERDPASYAIGLRRIAALKDQPELEGLV